MLQVVLDCHEAVSTRAAALAFLSIATVQSEREMADHLTSGMATLTERLSADCWA